MAKTELERWRNHLKNRIQDKKYMYYLAANFYEQQAGCSPLMATANQPVTQHNIFSPSFSDTRGDLFSVNGIYKEKILRQYEALVAKKVKMARNSVDYSLLQKNENITVEDLGIARNIVETLAGFDGSKGGKKGQEIGQVIRQAFNEAVESQKRMIPEFMAHNAQYVDIRNGCLKDPAKLNESFKILQNASTELERAGNLLGEVFRLYYTEGEKFSADMARCVYLLSYYFSNFQHEAFTKGPEDFCSLIATTKNQRIEFFEKYYNDIKKSSESKEDIRKQAESAEAQFSKEMRGNLDKYLLTTKEGKLLPSEVVKEKLQKTKKLDEEEIEKLIDTYKELQTLEQTELAKSSASSKKFTMDVLKAAQQAGAAIEKLKYDGITEVTTLETNPTAEQWHYFFQSSFSGLFHNVLGKELGEAVYVIGLEAVLEKMRKEGGTSFATLEQKLFESFQGAPIPVGNGLSIRFQAKQFGDKALNDGQYKKPFQKGDTGFETAVVKDGQVLAVTTTQTSNKIRFRGLSIEPGLKGQLLWVERGKQDRNLGFGEIHLQDKIPLQTLLHLMKWDSANDLFYLKNLLLIRPNYTKNYTKDNKTKRWKQVSGQNGKNGPDHNLLAFQWRNIKQAIYSEALVYTLAGLSGAELAQFLSVGVTTIGMRQLLESLDGMAPDGTPNVRIHGMGINIGNDRKTSLNRWDSIEQGEHAEDYEVQRAKRALHRSIKADKDITSTLNSIQVAMKLQISKKYLQTFMTPSF